MTPFAHTAGPRDARIAIVGEAWGKDEEELGGKPFVGYSGTELGRLLFESEIVRNPLPSRFIDPKAMANWWTLGPVFLTNVLALRPPNNDIEKLCVKKAETGNAYTMPPLRQGKYIRPDLLPQVERLVAELTAYPRNLVIALGNTACWALLHSTRIGALRGTVTSTAFGPHLKTIPTYHPAAILRNWALRPITLADLQKAKRESAFPEVRRQSRRVIYSATFDEISAWYARNERASVIACDTETGAGMIKCISFAASPSEALVIKFVDLAKPSGRHYDDARDEVLAWRWVQRILALPAAKLFQNGLYDLQYLWRVGIAPTNCTEDTMLLHHSMFPEMQKGLGFLGSIYCNEPAWKLMRRAESNKRDE